MRATRASLILAAALVLGCARTHLTESYGKSYRAAFARQDANPARRTRPAPVLSGLDAQEAGIVADGYRKSLAPAGARVPAEEPMILLAPAPKSRTPLAPSVPK